MRLSSLFLLIPALFIHPLSAQPMKAKIDMIGIFVEDMPQMVAFYRDILGFPVKAASPDNAYTEFECEGVRLSMFRRALLPQVLGQTPDYPKGLNGTFEIAFNVGAKENVDTTFDKFVKAGAAVVYAPRDEPWKMRSAMIADPEGNLIEIGSDFWQ
jgi:catechol 2,3-dioxygenase-like lactoylglutathione lyase family enzyme